jgi:predicted phage terminase large subunit-like protein
MGREVLQSILRSDFVSFLHKVFLTINPGGKFIPNWHIDLIASHLCQTKSRRIIINVPPRSLKSICVSVAWPAWILGQDPAKKIIVASYCEALSVKHSLDCKLVINSSWYKELFPKTVLSKSQNTKKKFMTTQNGFRLATSVGGYVTGEGADILIIDDPHNPTHVHSNLIRNQAINWYSNTFVTRLNSPESGMIALIMQRLHKDDLSGYLAKQGCWQMVKIPAVAEQDTIYLLGGKKFVFKKNSSLNSNHLSLQYLAKLKEEVGDYVFAAQYQQEPKDELKGMLEKSHICYYTTLPSDFDYMLQSWDTAVKVGSDSDFSVCTTWKVVGEEMYLVDIFRERLSYPNLKESMQTLGARFSPDIILVEDHSSGQSVAQDLLASGMSSIKPVRHKLDKVARFAMALCSIRAGKVLFPRSDFMERVLLPELLEFPNSKHDDMVDSLSQAINYSKGLITGEIRMRGLY